MSLPVRERGLKRNHPPSTQTQIQSLPVRERGLKLNQLDQHVQAMDVAPRAGAWVETITLSPLYHPKPGRSPCGSVG